MVDGRGFANSCVTTMSAFDPTSIDGLPDVVPIFPLPGAILLPRTVLPLNVFEPRYLNMVFDALAANRYVAMVQPREAPPTAYGPAVYAIGCLGRITAFNETDDGRLLITLKGICRYHIVEERELYRGYRRVRVDWSRFAGDLEPASEYALNIESFRASLQTYFDRAGLKVDWDGLLAMPNARMVDVLATNLPLDVDEKQALLEAVDVTEREQVLLTVANMAVRERNSESPHTRH